MKKVASILAVVVFTIGLFATQLTNNSNSFADFKNGISCGDCDNPINDDRGN